MRFSLYLFVSLLLLLAPLSFASQGEPVEVKAFLDSTVDNGAVVEVTGVVSVVYENAGRLALVDRNEAAKAGDSCCAGVPVTVLWKGEMPDANDTVVVTGEVKKRGRMSRVVATKVEVTKRPWESKAGLR